jgi:hypothetical protein
MSAKSRSTFTRSRSSWRRTVSATSSVSARLTSSISMPAPTRAKARRPRTSRRALGPEAHSLDELGQIAAHELEVGGLLPAGDELLLHPRSAPRIASNLSISELKVLDVVRQELGVAVDVVERVVDLVGDAGDQLPERGQLLARTSSFAPAAGARWSPRAAAALLEIERRAPQPDATTSPGR